MLIPIIFPKWDQRSTSRGGNELFPSNCQQGLNVRKGYGSLFAKALRVIL
jgi:hypothetical protein